MKVLRILSFISLGAGFLLAPESLPSGGACWMKILLGIPCPACGLTHGFLALGHGRFAEAWSDNPFSYLFFLLAVVLAVDALAGGRLLKTGGSFRLSGFWGPLLAGSMFAVWLARLI